MRLLSKIVSAFTAAAVLACTACSASGGAGGAATDGSPQSTESVSAADKTTVSDGLPAADYGGRAFRVGVRTPAEYEIFSEQTGEVTDDAIYNRNLRISERFKTEIKSVPISDDPQACYDNLIKNVRAGEDAYDLFGCYVYLLYTATSAEVLRNWIGVEHIDTSKPWWNAEINDNATINGVLYGLTGTLAITYMQYIEALFFNMSAVEDFGMTQEKLYSMVKNGEWTVDKLAECVSAMYDDVNGDSARDRDDRYGIAVSKWVSFDIWPAAFGIPITGKDEDGNITVEFINDKTVSALEKVIALFHDNPGGYVYPERDTSDNKHFIDGKTVFLPTYLLDAFDELRDMKTAYGILPIPKWDEAQDRYHSLVVDGYSIWQLPKTVSDTEFVGMITEALAADTYNVVYPVFYDVAMKNKYSEDEATAEMVDLVVENASFDFSFMYGIYLDMLPYQFRELLIKGNPDLISQYKRMEKSVGKKLEKLYELYQ